MGKIMKMVGIGVLCGLAAVGSVYGMDRGMSELKVDMYFKYVDAARALGDVKSSLTDEARERALVLKSELLKIYRDTEVVERELRQNWGPDSRETVTNMNVVYEKSFLVKYNELKAIVSDAGSRKVETCKKVWSLEATPSGGYRAVMKEVCN